MIRTASIVQVVGANIEGSTLFDVLVVNERERSWDQIVLAKTRREAASDALFSVWLSVVRFR